MESPVLLTSAEVAALLRIQPKTLAMWRWRKQVPYLRVNGAVRYRQSDIEALLVASLKPCHP